MTKNMLYDANLAHFYVNLLQIRNKKLISYAFMGTSSLYVGFSHSSKTGR